MSITFSTPTRTSVKDVIHIVSHHFRPALSRERVVQHALITTCSTVSPFNVTRVPFPVPMAVLWLVPACVTVVHASGRLHLRTTSRLLTTPVRHATPNASTAVTLPVNVERAAHRLSALPATDQRNYSQLADHVRPGALSAIQREPDTATLQLPVNLATSSYRKHSPARHVNFRTQVSVSAVRRLECASHAPPTTHCSQREYVPADKATGT
jgi:hypothetical protein